MEVLMGKSTINGPFSIAMLVYQRVTNDDKIAGSFKSLLSFIFGRMIPYDKPIFQWLKLHFEDQCDLENLTPSHPCWE
jgi:hypothetical protein